MGETRDPRLALVLEVMGALHSKHREVVLLKFVHGLSYKGIRHASAHPDPQPPRSQP